MIGIELLLRVAQQVSDRGAAFHARPGEIHAVEEIALRRHAVHRLEILEARRAPLRRAGALTAIQAARAAADLGVGESELGIVSARFERDHRRPSALASLELRIPGVPQQSLRLPRRRERELLRELLRVRRGAERLAREDRGRGVVPVPTAAVRAEAGQDDVGTEAPDHPHDVGEDAVVSPEPERLLRALREAEVERAREELLRAIEAARGEQLLRADHAEALAGLGAQDVLSAVAAGEREVCRAHEPTARETREQRGVVVVRMRADVQHAAHHLELAQRDAQLAGIERIGRARIGGDRGREECEQQQRGRERRGGARPEWNAGHRGSLIRRGSGAT